MFCPFVSLLAARENIVDNNIYSPCLRQVVEAVGGPAKLRRRLRGWLCLSWRYTRRLAALQALHAESPTALAYQQVRDLICASHCTERIRVGVGKLAATHCLEAFKLLRRFLCEASELCHWARHTSWRSGCVSTSVEQCIATQRVL